MALLSSSSSSSTSSSSSSSRRAYLITGGNKGQGLALCDRILSEHQDTFVFLGCRDVNRGRAAVRDRPSLRCRTDRVQVVELDVTRDESVRSAVDQVKHTLFESSSPQPQQPQPQPPLSLCGVISNAGILWNHTLTELLEVNTWGVKRLLDGFVPLLLEETNHNHHHHHQARVIIVSTGLAPLMHGYSSHGPTLRRAQSWEKDIQPLIRDCLKVERDDSHSHSSQTTLDIDIYEPIGFPGGPFAVQVPDFHRYGLSKMFADAYGALLARRYRHYSPSQSSQLWVGSVDPGLVYTDLIHKMPKYQNRPIDDIPGAKTPHQGVEVHMRLLFGEKMVEEEVTTTDDDGTFFWAVNKEGLLTKSGIDKRPDV